VGDEEAVKASGGIILSETSPNLVFLTENPRDLYFNPVSWLQYQHLHISLASGEDPLQTGPDLRADQIPQAGVVGGEGGIYKHTPDALHPHPVEEFFGTPVRRNIIRSQVETAHLRQPGRAARSGYYRGVGWKMIDKVDDALLARGRAHSWDHRTREIAVKDQSCSQEDEHGDGEA
jgi:hypothetical protein